MHQGSDLPAFVAADRLAAIGVSDILQLGLTAAAMKKAGAPVIVLGVGEPDFETPESVKQAAVRAILRGETKYTALDGSPAMKEAVAHKFRSENRLEFGPDEITVGAGAKQILFNAFMATLNHGDEVVLLAPYWTSYADIVQICGGVVRVIRCAAQNGFRATAEQLEAAITPRTRWVLLNSPSNPSGAAYGEDHLRPLLEVVQRYPHVWLMSDDIYEHIVYDGVSFVTPLNLMPGLRHRTLTVNGVSKAFAMTGWRIGYGAGPQELVKAMAVVQSQSTSNPSSVSQAAAIEALTGSKTFLTKRRNDFRIRRDYVAEKLNKIPGIDCRRPDGAFYIFASCAGAIGRRGPGGQIIRSDRDFATYLLREALVGVVPGSVFGLSPYFRLSYATSLTELDAALQRMAHACSRLVTA